ncbi:hypothetical protein G5C60_06495 [Streptomyces sp. HC44]|uniref:Uncharacterized protein n=1 Tax=Streptomyces scabichelini TaxID=2711217 RepID=A0A6G4UZT9_9ACTN|nr:hypothetical protein [Streptomyces scabichelini]NGO07308.1 hypothetical protein [Streptomyces scabichelini]
MASDYSGQLLESVSVRRRRLRDAVLFGAQRQRCSVDERLGKVFAGVVVAAVRRHHLAPRSRHLRGRSAAVRWLPTAPTPSATQPPPWEC